jgi:type II secretory pathway component GspD/PulD (secretin)
MEIDNKFDEPGETITIDGNPYPTVNERHASSTLTVNDGETIMLGGYITSTRSKSASGVPGLMNIPVLGALFRSKSTDNSREELIVLMRAKVLWTPADASAFAAREQNSLPGVRHAEDEEHRARVIELKAVEKQESKDRLLENKTNEP